MVALVIPALLLLILELVLVLAGVGHPTSFLVRRDIRGKAMLVDNPWFGLRFFPPALARSPSAISFPAEKEPGVFRIFLFGESAALGDPRPAYGMGRYLEALLNDRFPGTRIEVVCVAMTAINSHAILPMARECAHYKGDLWVIYMGNNEFAGPFGANTVFGPQAPPVWEVRLFLAIQNNRIGQLLVKSVRGLRSSHSTPASWGGLKMFLDHQLPPRDRRRARVYRNFQKNLEDILATARRHDVPVVLSSVASNLKDCPPFGSYVPPGLGGAQLTDWQRFSDLALTNAARRDFPEAAVDCRKALELNPESAQAQFQLGECLLALTNAESARRSFQSARDLDTLPFRTDSRLNEIIETTARRHGAEKVVFVNSEASLAPLSQSGIPGSESFLEHVHLNWDGNYRVALGLAQAATRCLPREILARQTSGWAGADACAQRLCLTDWNRFTILEDILRRLVEPPFTEQPNHEAQLARITNSLVEIRAGEGQDAARAARGMFDAQIQQHPDDQWLHHNFAEFLIGTGDLGEATRQMQIVCELLPENHAVYFQLGRLLARQKKYDQAESCLETAVKLRPELANSRVEFGQVLAVEGKFESALAQYEAAERCYGADEARLHLLRADVLSRQNKHDAAIEQLRHAVQIRQSFWEAYELMGMEFALETNYPSAQLQFEQVVKLRPSYAEGHLNLGIALARQRRFPEAVGQFETTLRLDPKNGQAQNFLSALKGFQAQ